MLGREGKVDGGHWGKVDGGGHTPLWGRCDVRQQLDRLVYNWWSWRNRHLKRRRNRWPICFSGGVEGKTGSGEGMWWGVSFIRFGNSEQLSTIIHWRACWATNIYGIYWRIPSTNAIINMFEYGRGTLLSTPPSPTLYVYLLLLLHHLFDTLHHL